MAPEVLKNKIELDGKTKCMAAGITQAKLAKEMLLVEDVDNRERLCGLILSMFEELPKANLKKNMEGKE